MRPIRSFSVVLSCALFVLFFICFSYGQQPAVQPRISQAIDESSLSTLHGNTHPLARARYDQGPAPSSLPMQRMLLVLKRSDEQEAVLRQLLDAQQDKSSPNYHKWLPPDEFGRRFGPADQDIESVKSWLQSHGFQAIQVSKGRTVIEFSGTAAMVQDAFHTAIHKYAMTGESHWANASDPSIPTALTPVVAGVWTLHNFLKKPSLVMAKEHLPLVDVPGSEKPQLTTADGRHFLTPGDYAVIYDINPVYQSGITGTNVTIAVVARTDINFSDVSLFRSIFNLPAASFQLVPNGPDPGDLGGDEEAEAVLDTTWSGAVAQTAALDLVVSASTNTTDGADLSELYIVDNNLGDVMTESFSVCEADATSAQLTGISSVAEQAAAQGITYVVSAGDTGSAGCDNLGETKATGPVSVNALASTQFNVAVGGTIFNENGHDSTYWSSSTSQNVTALQYIPEDVWNESCTTCDNPNIAAGGGGASTVVSKPYWQSGLTGIPSDGFRDVPDVSLAAALHDPYLLCLAGSCNQGFLVGIGGTSAAAPSFAGIMALVDQKMGGRVGLPDYVLYKLAASENLSQCNGSSTSSSPASQCVFNDVTVGNNAVPGETSYGSSNPQFMSGTGYDLATGLGSVQASNLVNNWNSVSFKPTTTTLTLSPQTSIAHGSAVTVGITVAPQSGPGTPTGDISLLSNASATATGGSSVDRFTLTNGGVATTTHLLPGGTNTITAHYAGDASFAPSDSQPVQVTVNPEPSTTTLSVFTTDNNGKTVTFTGGPYGGFVYPRADVVGHSGYGIPTSQVTISDNGSFVVALTLNSQGNTAPPNGLFNFTPGPHSLTATYQGDPSFQPSSPSAPVNFTITKATTVTTVSSQELTQGASFTAIVSTSSFGASPTGSVSFYSGGTSLGSFPVSGGGAGMNGTASATAFFSDSQLANGQYSITATYSGDTNYGGSTSSALNVNLQPDFTMIFLNSTMPVTRGSAGNLMLNVTALDGFNGMVNFTSASCSGLPTEATCSFSPPSVTGSGATNVSVSTTGPHPLVMRTGSLSWVGGGTVAMGCLVGIAFLGGGNLRALRPALVVVICALLIAVLGCSGGGSSNSGGTPQTDPGTPAGSYVITVTAVSGTITHTTNFTLQVQ
jgi:Pro-kumamolisin, activation domain/Bacterial Ig-like domain (group 3)